MKNEMKKGIKWYFGLLGILILLMIVGTIFRFLVFPLFVVQKVQDSAEKVVSKTLDSDNVLFNYENFKDLYNGAKQQVANIKKAKKSMDDLKSLYGEDAKNWTKDVRQQQAFLQENVDGYSMQYQNIASRYNSDSKKLNRNLFKDKELPYEIPLNSDELN